LNQKKSLWKKHKDLEMEWIREITEHRREMKLKYVREETREQIK